MSDETKPDFTKITPPPDATEVKDVKEEKPKLKEKPKEDRPRLRRQKLPTLEEQLNEVFAGFAMGVAATGDFYCAEHIANQAPVMAKAWADLAKTNEAVERALIRMMQGSAWGAVFFATAATVIPIAAHHGLYPKRFPMPFEFGLGPPPPESNEVKKEREERK